jgi:hypothetical protein
MYGRLPHLAASKSCHRTHKIAATVWLEKFSQHLDISCRINSNGIATSVFKGLIMSFDVIATQTVTFGEWRGL